MTTENVHQKPTDLINDINNPEGRAQNPADAAPHAAGALPVVSTAIEKHTQAETLLPIDTMYSTIGRTLQALDITTVDGAVSPDIDLQAHTHKALLPDTEIEMLHSKAVPMTGNDLKEFQEQQKRLQSVQYRQKQLQNPAKTLAEITGARVRVAYRLVRYMSHIRGIGGVGEPLILSMASSSPQVNVFEIPIPYDPTVGWYRGLGAVRNLLAQSDTPEAKYTYSINGEIYTTTGMSVLPPPLHDGYYPQNGHPRWEYRRRKHTPQNYRADTDGPLAIYLNICELLVRHLGIGTEDTDEQAAAAALLNPSIARLAWPCRDDIETFEEYVLLPYIGRIIVDRAQDSAIVELKKEMGLTHAEAFDLVETYKTYSQFANVYDPEKERSIMLGRLDGLMEECGEAGMVTTKLNALKTSLQVLGLTRHDEDSTIDKRASLGDALEADIVGKGKNEKLLPVVDAETN